MRAPKESDVAVVGIGLETALGDTVATWNGLQTAATAIETLPTGPQAARVDSPTLEAELSRVLAPQLKFLSGSGVMAAMATQTAWSEAASSDVPDTQRGLYLAQMDADDWNCHHFRNASHAASDALPTLSQEAMNRASQRHVKPFFLLEGLKNNAFSFLATWFDLRGANASTAGCTSLGTALLDMARRAIEHGVLRRAVVVGAARFSSNTALFEIEQQGLPLVTGDAAASIVLAPCAEAPDDSVSIVGVGSATDLTGSAHARAQALVAAASQALEEASVQSGELTAVVTPGTGLQAERDALQGLPKPAQGVPVVCWSGSTGYTTLASDALDLALAAIALRTGVIAPGRSTRLATVTEPLAAPAGSAILVLSLGTFGHAGAVVLQS